MVLERCKPLNTPGEQTKPLVSANRKTDKLQQVYEFTECTNTLFPQPFFFGVFCDNSSVYEMHLQNLMQSDTTVMQ